VPTLSARDRRNERFLNGTDKHPRRRSVLPRPQGATRSVARATHASARPRS
jgi:hypothetical protein